MPPTKGGEKYQAKRGSSREFVQNLSERGLKPSEIRTVVDRTGSLRHEQPTRERKAEVTRRFFEEKPVIETRRAIEESVKAKEGALSPEAVKSIIDAMNENKTLSNKELNAIKDSMLGLAADVHEVAKEALKDKSTWKKILEKLPGIIKFLSIAGLVGFAFWKFDDMAKASSGCYRGSTKKQIPESKVACSSAQCDCAKMICPEGQQCQPCSEKCTDENGYYYVWREYSMFDMFFQTAANGLDLLSNGFLSFGKPLATIAIIAGATFLGFIVLSFLYKRIDMYLENKRKEKALTSGGEPKGGALPESKLRPPHEFAPSQEALVSPSKFYSSSRLPREFRFHQLEKDVLRSYKRNYKKF